MKVENIDIAKKLMQKYQLTEKVIKEMTTLVPDYNVAFRVYVPFYVKDGPANAERFIIDIPEEDVKRAVKNEIERLKNDLQDLKKQIDAL